MNKPTRILALLAFAALSGTAMAQEKVELVVAASDADGEFVASSVVTMDSKLSFTKAGVEVYNGETLDLSLPYADIAKLTFRYSKNTGVATVVANSGLRLRNNPVAESLAFVGFGEGVKNLVVTDLKGSIRVSIPEWKGEAVNVGDLTPGLYFVTVDKTTFKFIKK